MSLTLERLKQVLSYDPGSGDFRWKVTLNHRGRAGTVAGCICKASGYRKVRIDDVLYQSHRLAWFYMNGAWPENKIDHRNGVRSDNRIANIRDVTTQINNQNRHRTRKGSKTGVVGVTIEDRKFIAKIFVNKKQITLGRFQTIEAATAARAAARKQYYPEA